jgi:GTPase SAR1 family protein
MGGGVSASRSPSYSAGGPSPLRRTSAVKADKQITQQLAAAKKEDRDQRKVLLLGAGNCGKSTMFKQFRIICDSQGLGDLRLYREIVSHNLLVGFCAALTFVFDVGLPHDDEVFRQHTLPEWTRALERARDAWSDVGEAQLTLSDVTSMPLAEALKALWACPSVALAACDPEAQVEVQVEYLMSRIDVIGQPSYVPTIEDVMKLRQRTSGVQSCDVKFEGSNLRIIDVGGQRSERKKWVSQFDRVHTILFVVALDDFDRTLMEDNSANRLRESLAVFKDIVECPYFERTPVVFLLNKKDEFYRKIVRDRRDLRRFFPDYAGAVGDYRAAVDFVRSLFKVIFDASKADMPPAQRPEIIFYNTVATDTDNINKVIQSAKVFLIAESFL